MDRNILPSVNQLSCGVMEILMLLMCPRRIRSNETSSLHAVVVRTAAGVCMCAQIERVKLLLRIRTTGLRAGVEQQMESDGNEMM